LRDLLPVHGGGQGHVFYQKRDIVIYIENVYMPVNAHQGIWYFGMVARPNVEGFSVSAARPVGIGGLDPEAGEWLADLTRTGRAPRTVDCYARDIRDAERVITVILGRCASAGDLARLGQAEVDEICGAWERAGASVQTVLRRFAALRGFGRHLVATKGADCSRLLCARLPKVTRQPCVAVDPISVNALTDDRLHLRTESWIELRDRAVFALMASTGMTPGEAVALDRSQAFGRGGAITISDTHLRPRTVAASAEAEEVVRGYLASLPPAIAKRRPLFVNRRGGRLGVRSIQKSFRSRGAAIGRQGPTGPMGLRHAAGRALAHSSGSPATLAQALGISVSTATKYFRS
jgi:integrase/recombinase XerC